MADNKNEIVEQPKQSLTFSEVLTNSLNEVNEALPMGFNKVRFVQNAIALLNDNDTLKTFATSYGTAQIKIGLLKGAYLDLDFCQNEAYLIPYGKTLNFMPSYKGKKKLCMKYSTRPIQDIYAKVVREGDVFEEKIIDGRPSLDFKPLAFNNKPIVGAFAVCLFKDGGMIYDAMSLAELEQTRKASKMSKGVTWTQYTSEMYKKTVLNRLTKHIQIDFDTPEQRRYFDEDLECDFGDEKPKKKKASINSVLNDDDDNDIENEDIVDVVSGDDNT